MGLIMSDLDIQKIFDIYSYQYVLQHNGHSHYTFLINNEGYIPLIVPDIHDTTIESILPQEGVEIPYIIEDGTLMFDEEWYGCLAVCKQYNTAINGKFIKSYTGNNIKLSYRLNASIIDGGFLDVSNLGDIDLSPGIVSNNNRLVQFCGYRWPLSETVISLPKGRGFSFALFLIINDDQLDGLTLQPIAVKTDLIVTQIGDYRTLYGVIKSLYGVDYTSVNYIEFVRGQLISQSPSTPYIVCRYDARVRKPTTSNYPLPIDIG